MSTDLWARVVLLVTPRSGFPPRYAPLPARRIHLFTAVQLAMFTLCWAVNLSPLGLCVAFVVVSLVPLRERVLPSVFTPDELALLDAGRIAAPATQDSPPSRSAHTPVHPRTGVLLPFGVTSHAVEAVRRGAAAEAKSGDPPPLATISEGGEAASAKPWSQYRRGDLSGRMAMGGGQGFSAEGAPAGGGAATHPMPACAVAPAVCGPRTPGGSTPPLLFAEEDQPLSHLPHSHSPLAPAAAPHSPKTGMDRQSI